MPEPSQAPQPAGLMKGLALLVLILMLGAIIYSTWIAVRNWAHIGV